MVCEENRSSFSAQKREKVGKCGRKKFELVWQKQERKWKGGSWVYALGCWDVGGLYKKLRNTTTQMQ